MTVTPSTVVVGVEPDITFAIWDQAMMGANSPALSGGDDDYRTVVDHRVSPAFALAIFKHESRFGTVGIVPAHDLKNPGATRSIRTGNGRVIQIPNRGPFVRYDTWADGWLDLAFRLVDPSYVYAREGRTTIRQIIERWAPSSDGNVPASYVKAVVRDMNEWIETMPSVDDDRFAWAPDATEFGYPKGTHGRNGNEIELAVVHITAGVDSLGWLTGEHGSSTHYLSDRSFRPRVQMVREMDAAWTAGNRDYNLRGLQFEFETRAQTPITEMQLRNAADTMRPILQRLNIPLVYIGRDNGPGQRGIIGHADVPDGRGGWGGSGNHIDPGEYWDWGRFIDLLNDRATDGPPTLPRTVPDPWGDSNPWHDEYWIPQPFVDHINAGDWMTVGYAVSEAFVEGDAIVQYFERARLEFRVDGSVSRGLVGYESMIAKYPERET